MPYLCVLQSAGAPPAVPLLREYSTDQQAKERGAFLASTQATETFAGVESLQSSLETRVQHVMRVLGVAKAEAQLLLANRHWDVQSVGLVAC